MISLNSFNSSERSHRLWQEKEDSTLIRFFPAINKKSDAAIVIFAGGAYTHRALHESDGYAEFFAKNGINAFVVDYRVSPDHFPAQLSDARRGVRFVRYYSGKYGIDKEKIAVIGSSAGGHLAALVSTYRGELEGEGADEIDKESYLPDAQILCYPVINTTDSEIMSLITVNALLGEDNLSFAPEVSPDLIADEKTPQAFIWHTVEDGSVNVINSYEYASALRRQNVPVEMHIFPNGHHGLGLCDIFSDTPDAAKKMRRHTGMWKELLLSWLSYIGYLNLN